MRSATDERSAAIVRSTVGLAHALDMRIIAEGVENAQVLDQLTATGCDLAQGYHLSRPQPPAQLTAWLGQQQHQTPPEYSSLDRPRSRDTETPLAHCAPALAVTSPTAGPPPADVPRPRGA
jgi:predicted signal transduction protein with EAL and GGDEF domain